MNRNTLCRYSRFYAFTTTLINPHSGWEERKKHDDPRFLIRHLVDRSWPFLAILFGSFVDVEYGRINLCLRSGWEGGIGLRKGRKEMNPLYQLPTHRILYA